MDQIDADVYTAAQTTGAGVLVGSIHHVGIGVGQGALIGAGLGLAKVRFTRGDEISLPAGTWVEMVLQRPLTVQATSIAKPNDSADAKHQCTIQKEQNTNQLEDNAPCLHDGVTFECVAQSTVAGQQLKFVLLMADG